MTRSRFVPWSTSRSLTTIASWMAPRLTNLWPRSATFWKTGPKASSNSSKVSRVHVMRARDLLSPMQSSSERVLRTDYWSGPWGIPPWTIDFQPRKQPLPDATDFVIVGGGFTGLAAAAWLRLIAPEKSVVVLEAERIGSGASGRTGGQFLGETAAGDQEGLGDVIAGVESIFAKLS